jgi:hypothetical protein
MPAKMSNPKISSSSARREVDCARIVCELTTRLQDKEEALLAERAASKTERIEEAHQMPAYVESVASDMAGKMRDRTDGEELSFSPCLNLNLQMVLSRRQGA